MHVASTPARPVKAEALRNAKLNFPSLRGEITDRAARKEVRPDRVPEFGPLLGKQAAIVDRAVGGQSLRGAALQRPKEYVFAIRREPSHG